ncbi:MAG: DNA mismatch repair endonuclease MutL [Phaeodactylibacter sp.]|nr:DNA mismatch repair endonuclease MutL [Phaeodactylibacter sp.]
MADIIQLLPDAIANQIAAGEVIQRPASAVKELLENAVDAGADQIRVIIKDAGKTLIQVIDNGMGMSATDARMSFERHATSKIRQADDLFAIKTMGFRGEALASIAAIAQVEMRTRQHQEELGSRLIIEGSEVKSQEPCQCTAGTSIQIKNLFFNVPARRKFLKTDAVEMKHINDEFIRVALAYPEIHFSLHHNGNELFHLKPGRLRQRIVGVLGNQANKKLVPVHVDPDIIRIEGFVGKPEYAKKTRGDQFFFVNNRFIRSNYLHHAVLSAYENLIPEGTFPLYVIFIDLDPQQIDINVHPTKQHIKFDDERIVYNCLNVSVRHALGQHSITPTLDFEQEQSFKVETTLTRAPGNATAKPSNGNGPSFKQSGEQTRQSNNLKNWESLYEGLKEISTEPSADPEVLPQEAFTIESKFSDAPPLDEGGRTLSKPRKVPYQIHASYIVSPIKSGFLLIDQQAAHERILYEEYLTAFESYEPFSQKELFPKTITVSPVDALILKEILPQVNALGFDIRDFGQNTFVIHGVPAEMPGGHDEQKLIEQLIEQYKSNLELQLGIRENIARSLARSASIKKGKVLSAEEMQALIDKLFACAVPYKAPSGRNCFISFDLKDLEQKFNH